VLAYIPARDCIGGCRAVCFSIGHVEKANQRNTPKFTIGMSIVRLSAPGCPALEKDSPPCRYNYGEDTQQHEQYEQLWYTYLASEHASFLHLLF
jgi:hypothetical protein